MRYFFPIFIAIRYFLAKKNEKFLSVISFIALIGNALGVAALIIVTSVMNGFHLALIENVIGINGEIKLSFAEGDSDKIQKLQDHLSRYPFIMSSDPIIYEKVLLLGRQVTTGAIVKSFEFEVLNSKNQIVDGIVLGDVDNFELDDVIFIGKPLADQLGLKIGSDVKMIASKYKASLFGSLPRVKNFTVGAIYQTGFYDLDMFSVLSSPRNIRNFLGVSDEYFNSIEVKVDDIEKTDEYGQIIKSVLKNDKQDKVQISTWKDNNKQLIESLKLEKTSMIIILTVIIIVAAFNILSGLFIFVKEKTKDISILKKIGASNFQIMFIFFVHGLIIAILSIFVGLILGFVILYNINHIVQFLEKFFFLTIFDPAIYYLTEVPYLIKISDVFMILITSFSLSILASIYPSFRAARLNPVNLARYE